MAATPVSVAAEEPHAPLGEVELLIGLCGEQLVLGGNAGIGLLGLIE